MKKIKELCIKEEQKIILDVLNFFDEICNVEKITYFLAYGTLLGAVREKGFIEWDDDIDIWMKREDYEKFISIYHKYNNKNYFLQSVESDRYMVAPGMARICINNTYKWPEKCEKEKFHKGIYFDIFPLDYAPAERSICFKQNKRCALLYSMLWAKLPCKNITSIKDLIFTLISRIVPRKIINKALLHMQMSNIGRNKSEFICYSIASLYPLNIYKASWFEETINCKFENRNYPCPKGYCEILDYKYGDWENPPEQKPKHVKAYFVK